MRRKRIAAFSCGVGKLAADPITETLVHTFIDLIAERKMAGKRELAATMVTVANWMSERTGLPIEAKHIQPMTTAMREANLITVGGGGIGRPNTYDTTEREMGSENFWNQVEAFLHVWNHPSRKALAG